MRFEDILHNGRLWAVVYDGDTQDALTKTFASWLDPGFLEDFFSRNIKDLETLQGSLVTVIDVYLFAMVLLIFGVGIYELFINQIDPVDDKHSNRPSWLHVTCIDDLKASLGKSILMVLIVALYKYALNITAASAGTASVVNLLHFAGVIVLVALSLFLTSLSSHRKNASSNNKKKEGK